MTILKIRIFSFVIYAIYLLLALLLLGALFLNKTILDIKFMDIAFPLIVSALIVFIIDYQRSYYLDPGQEEVVRDHLRKMGYMPTADKEKDIFFRRRKLVTWHTARLIKGEKYLILKSSENHGKYFSKRQKED